MDDLDAGAQPHCPEDGTVLRLVRGAYACPECGHLELLDEVEMPPEFEGPDIHLL